MRSLQMVMFMLCVLGGLFLLVQGPVFFMPARTDPAIGLHFDTLASRLLAQACSRWPQWAGSICAPCITANEVRCRTRRPSASTLRA